MYMYKKKKEKSEYERISQNPPLPSLQNIHVICISLKVEALSQRALEYSPSPGLTFRISVSQNVWDTLVSKYHSVKEKKKYDIYYYNQFLVVYKLILEQIDEQNKKIHFRNKVTQTTSPSVSTRNENQKVWNVYENRFKRIPLREYGFVEKNYKNIYNQWQKVKHWNRIQKVTKYSNAQLFK